MLNNYQLMILLIFVNMWRKINMWFKQEYVYLIENDKKVKVKRKDIYAKYP